LRHPELESQIPSNISMVRLRLIGDVVFTTPAIRALRRRYPDARLSYIVEPDSRPSCSAISPDEVIVARAGAPGRCARIWPDPEVAGRNSTWLSTFMAAAQLPC
jgi:hypothetical protein